MKYNVLSGGFDPLTPGHVSVINKSYENRKTIIILNTDEWLVKKKGAAFIPYDHRKAILLGLNNVEAVIQQIDDDMTVSKTLRFLCDSRPKDNFVFINSGDKTTSEVPEYKALKGLCSNLTYETALSEFDKVHSSQYLYDWTKLQLSKKLSEIPPLITMQQRPWGHWEVLREYKDRYDFWYKIKLLVIKPKQKLSMQRHQFRREIWRVLDGYGIYFDGDFEQKLNENIVVNVPANRWHQIINHTDIDLVILEIQKSTEINMPCDESDIERR